MTHAEAIAKMEGALSALEPWSADAARRCVTYAVGVIEREKATGLDVSIEIEMQLPGASIGIPRGGTADLVVLVRDQGKIVRVVVVDYKLGFLDQGEAADHKQLWAYAVMAARKYEPTMGVEIHLAQGRRRDFSAAWFDLADIENAAEHCKRIAMAAFGADPELRPAIDACRYCKALPMCRAAREEIMKATEELALFGVDDTNRMKMAETAKIAGRFAEEVRALQKEWVNEAQGVAA
jgi:hypothetical protein